MSEARTKKKSIAAFILMPQFSFEGFAHIVPIFMRTLGIIFAQAGLIPVGHPATRYGVEGVRKYSFGELMGEAWFTLRTTRATPYQWGAFSMVIFMITTLLTAFGVFFANVVFGLGTAARAQIFELRNEVYRAGAGETDLEAVEAMGVQANNPIFDTRYARSVQDWDGGASLDYALMVLDKVLRQGAVGTGGVTQNALGALMQTYNTGALVVAAVILFWMITSIVVDTAKTGIVGGGRHNMVWAPIRVVFALGIMVPLGTTGFSSGQYMVMKLAEWGSNLGSNGWVAYIDAVTDNYQLLGPVNQGSVSSIATGLSKIQLCRAAYDAYLMESTRRDGAFNPTDPAFNERSIRPIPQTDARTGHVTMLFGNSTDPAMCGGFTTIRRGLGAADATDSGILQRQIAAKYASGGDLLRDAANIVKEKGNIITARLLDPGDLIANNARDFACSFVKHSYLTGITPHPVDNIPFCRGYNEQECYDRPNTGNYGTWPARTAGVHAPTASCQQNIVDSLMTTIKDQHRDGIAQLNTFINNDASLRQEMAVRGWGGMGMWYNYISRLSEITQKMGQTDVRFIAGELWTHADGSDVGKHTVNIVDKFNDWWAAEAKILNGATNVRNADPLSFQVNQSAQIEGDKSYMKEAKSLKESSSADQTGKATSNKVADWVQGRDDDWFFFSVLTSSSDGAYPMAEVVASGHSIKWMGIAMLGAISAIQTVLGGLEVCGGVSLIFVSGEACFSGESFANGALFSGLQSIAITLIVCGLVIGYYLPLLPMIRVAFAVLTWIISVFEAVCMVPIAGLAHLTSEGEGLAGGAKNCWILWLNILMRPILVVLGFVGAMLIYNTFIVYFHAVFINVAAASVSGEGGLSSLISRLIYSVIYMAIMYSSANVIFKMLDTVPNGLMRWMGASPDQSFDHDNTEGMMIAGSNMLGKFVSPYGRGGGGKGGKGGEQGKPGGENTKPGATDGSQGGGTGGTDSGNANNLSAGGAGGAADGTRSAGSGSGYGFSAGSHGYAAGKGVGSELGKGGAKGDFDAKGGKGFGFTGNISFGKKKE